MFRALNGVMAALFVLSALVQFNDPDPVPWIAVYSAAALLSALVAFGRRVYLPGSIALGIVALVWAITLALQAEGVPTLEELFEFQTMKTSVVEVARETLGLVIVGGWMLAQVVSALSSQHSRRP